MDYFAVSLAIGLQPDPGSSALPLAWVITETDGNTETFFLKIRYNFF
jgi:hypothetical protein